MAATRTRPKCKVCRNSDDHARARAKVERDPRWGGGRIIELLKMFG